VDRSTTSSTFHVTSKRVKRRGRSWGASRGPLNLSGEKRRRRKKFRLPLPSGGRSRPGEGKEKPDLRGNARKGEGKTRRFHVGLLHRTGKGEREKKEGEGKNTSADTRLSKKNPWGHPPGHRTPSGVRGGGKKGKKLFSQPFEKKKEREVLTSSFLALGGEIHAYALLEPSWHREEKKKEGFTRYRFAGGREEKGRGGRPDRYSTSGFDKTKEGRKAESFNVSTLLRWSRTGGRRKRKRKRGEAFYSGRSKEEKGGGLL